MPPLEELHPKLVKVLMAAVQDRKDGKIDWRELSDLVEAISKLHPLEELHPELVKFLIASVQDYKDRKINYKELKEIVERT